MATIKSKATEHQDYLDRDTKFLTVQMLKERWGCSKSTVRMIPRSELPYANFGHGLQRELRRYAIADVHAYETRLVQQSA